VDEESTRPGHWLGLVLCVPLSALTLMVGWQQGHSAHTKTRSTNLQRFSTGTAGRRGSKEELAESGSPERMAIKHNY